MLRPPEAVCYASCDEQRWLLPFRSINRFRGHNIQTNNSYRSPQKPAVMRCPRVVIDHQPYHPQRTRHAAIHAASQKPTHNADHLNAALHALQLFGIAAASTCTILSTRPAPAPPARRAAQHTSVAQPPPHIPASACTWFVLLALAASAWLSQRLHATLRASFGCVLLPTQYPHRCASSHQGRVHRGPGRSQARPARHPGAATQPRPCQGARFCMLRVAC